MQPSDAPRKEFIRAEACARALHSAESFEEMHEHWVSFLHRLERIWYKSEAHFGKSPKWQGWKGRFEKHRNNDELLKYLRHARGAEEHTVGPIAFNADVNLLPVETGQQMPNFTFEMDDQGNGQIKSDGPFSMQWNGDGLQLLDIKNRGAKYSVPTSHLGQQVNPSNLLQISDHALSFYSGFLEAAEKEFYK